MRWPFVWWFDHDLLKWDNDRLRNELLTERARAETVIDRWNALVKRINDRGGEQFLASAKIPAPLKGLSEADMKKLLMLIHPDKHANSELSKEMTVKILEMRN